jgi:glycosyltransferase involved in cell wall biosynthesis
MRIAQISPLMESVPPRLYGGTERVVSYLTEELVALGHDVTLFASGDSMTDADFVPCCRSALRLEAEAHDPIPHHMIMLDKLMRVADRFDVLPRIDYLHFPLIGAGDQAVTTLHGRQDLPANDRFYRYFRQAPLVSISQAQRKPIPHANFIATIHHGMPLDLHHAEFNPEGKYLAFLGRISPEKDPIQAIRIAHALNMELKIAAKVDRVDEHYFASR